MFWGRASTERDGKLLGTDPPDTFEANLDTATRMPALLAFHGFTGTVSELLPLLRGVAAEGFPVRAPLLPGHGTRPHELQAVTFDDLLRFGRVELAALAARHPRVVVLGFSYGSLIATELAADGNPAAVGLAVLGNAIDLPWFTRGPLGLARRAGVAMPDVYVGKPLPADMADRDGARRIATYDRHPMRAAMEVYLAGRRARTRLGDIGVPVLVLHGERDRVCPARNARRYARAVGSRDVTLRVYRRSAHLVAVDHDKEAVLGDVLSFLGRFSG